MSAILVVLGAGLAGGCANSPFDGATSLTTASVSGSPAADPACVSLAAQIDNLRKDGAAERLEKASTGKSSNVQVKRLTLAKQAELNKANAQFQARCSTIAPRQAAPATAPASAPANAAAPAGKGASAGEAVVPPMAKTAKAAAAEAAPSGSSSE